MATIREEALFLRPDLPDAHRIRVAVASKHGRVLSVATKRMWNSEHDEPVPVAIVIDSGDPTKASQTEPVMLVCLRHSAKRPVDVPEDADAQDGYLGSVTTYRQLWHVFRAKPRSAPAPVKK